MTSQITTSPTGLAEHPAPGSTPVSMLRPDDVCDRCGVRAYVLVIFDGGSELTFCGHHAHAYRHELTRTALVIHNETAQLTAHPTATHPNPPIPSPQVAAT